MSASSSSANNSLRPAWNRGSSKGFQPPPAVASERSSSTGNAKNQARDYNKFAALDPDDEDALVTEAAEAAASSLSRSDALRSAGRAASSAGGASGRSLADLAARAPPPPEGPRRLSALRSGSEGSASDHKEMASQVKVVRFTRERLLSMRPPQPRASPPDRLAAELEGSVILSLEPQDPVCWDNLDAEEIWAAVPPRRGSSLSSNVLLGKEDSVPVPGRRGSTIRRESSTSAGGRWQRGVALPTESSGKPGGGGSNRSSSKEAENPNDLWDDPGGAADSGAAADFSAFGSMPADDNTGSDEPFDFDKMAEASRKLEEEMHGRRSRASSNASASEVAAANVHTVAIDANRPLAAAGTTIRSGSGDDVNVFEDFDENDVAAPAEEGEPAPIQKADADPNASSRLMAMIGVQKDASVASDPKLSAWGSGGAAAGGASGGSADPVAAAAAKDALAGIPLNPWGGPMLGSGDSGPQTQGLDLQAQLREAELKQKAAVAAEAQRRREQEEAQLRRQQQEDQERQRQQQSQSQQEGVQSQVELVLMERISTILENSWGRSDLVSILSTLHAEDSRVIPLLSNVDALRALLLRNPRRVAIRQDPALRAEMAALLVTNAQWQQQQLQQQQQQQQQQALQRQQQQQEELQRREQHQRRLEAEQAAAAQQQQRIVPDAPWYYSDPSKNIQGPFRGEEMRQWLEAGYFKGDLPISQNPSGPFRPLSAIFTDLSMAFVFKLQDTADEERRRAEEQARREGERARAEAEAEERERQREQQQQQERERQLAREKEEERLARAEAAAKQANGGGGNESSAQLKLMLGLGAQGGSSEQQQQEQSVQQKQQQPKAEEKKASKKKAQQPAELSSSPDAAAKNAPPAWGGAAASKPASRKSMSEIQKEEARAAAVAAMNRQGGRSSSSGWANVAAKGGTAKGGGSTGWSGGAPQHPAVMANAGGRQSQARSVSLQPTSNVAAANAQLAAASAPPGKVQRSSSATAADAADAFGAKMSPDFEKWCKDQMAKLNGTDDLTLVAFCMTLNDADEIRQYFAAYLGSTPQVNAFATEFISRKGGSQGKQDEWESTVPVKKGRKKKAGAR